MAQGTQPATQGATDRYGDVALGVESAWPQALGAPAAAQGFFSSPSSSPTGNSGAGVALSLAAAVLLSSALVASAAPYAPAEYDFSDAATLELSASGIVESVREVPLRADPAGLAGVFEHSVNPETGEELVVRLDDGRAVTVVLDGLERFRLGERVRVVGGRVLRT